MGSLPYSYCCLIWFNHFFITWMLWLHFSLRMYQKYCPFSAPLQPQAAPSLWCHRAHRSKSPLVNRTLVCLTHKSRWDVMRCGSSCPQRACNLFWSQNKHKKKKREGKFQTWTSSQWQPIRPRLTLRKAVDWGGVPEKETTVYRLSLPSPCGWPLLIPGPGLWGRIYHPHFREEEIEVRNDEMSSTVPHT